MKLRIVSEGFGIDEEVEMEKWVAGDILLKRKAPKRFEFLSGFEKDDFNYRLRNSYRGYLKGSKTYHEATISIVDEKEESK